MQSSVIQRAEDYSQSDSVSRHLLKPWQALCLLVGLYHIAADTLMHERGFTIRVPANDDELLGAARQLGLKAKILGQGMRVTVEIKTGQRRVIEYLLNPVRNSHIIFAKILVIVIAAATTSAEVRAKETPVTRTLCEITARQFFEPFKPSSKTIKSDCTCALKKLGENVPETISEWEASGTQSPLLALTNCSARWIVDAYAKETHKSSRERLRRQGFNFEQINKYSLCVGEASFNHMRKVIQEDIDLDRLLQKKSMENCERRAHFN